jgi:hypothetical protein
LKQWKKDHEAAVKEKAANKKKADEQKAKQKAKQKAEQKQEESEVETKGKGKGKGKLQQKGKVTGKKSTGEKDVHDWQQQQQEEWQTWQDWQDWQSWEAPEWSDQEWQQWSANKGKGTHSWQQPQGTHSWQQPQQPQQQQLDMGMGLQQQQQQASNQNFTWHTSSPYHSVLSGIIMQEQIQHQTETKVLEMESAYKKKAENDSRYQQRMDSLSQLRNLQASPSPPNPYTQTPPR